jgi:hypothetical protein
MDIRDRVKLMIYERGLDEDTDLIEVVESAETIEELGDVLRVMSEGNPRDDLTYADYKFISLIRNEIKNLKESKHASDFKGIISVLEGYEKKIMSLLSKRSTTDKDIEACCEEFIIKLDTELNKLTVSLKDEYADIVVKSYDDIDSKQLDDVRDEIQELNSLKGKLKSVIKGVSQKAKSVLKEKKKEQVSGGNKEIQSTKEKIEELKEKLDNKD